MRVDASRRQFLRFRPTTPASGLPQSGARAADEPAIRSIAAFGAACFAARGIVCQSCADHCPTAAIRFRPRLGGPPQPLLDAASCDGCGACLPACPADAIRLQPVDA